MYSKIIADLAKKKSEAVEPEKLLEYIPVEAEPVKRVMAYSNITSGLLRNTKFGSKELIGLFSNELDRYDGVITGATLSPGQDVTSSRCRMDPDSVFNASDEINEKGNKVVGWWHSHGDDYDNFFSNWDVNNMEGLFRDISGHNKKLSHYQDVPIGNQPYRCEQSKRGGNTVLTIRSCDPVPKTLEIELNDVDLELNQGSHITRLVEKVFLGINYAYGITVNSRNDMPFGYLIYKDPESGLIVPKPNHKITTVGNIEDAVLDYEKLQDEVERKVRVGDTYIKDLPGKSEPDYEEIESSIMATLRGMQGDEGSKEQYWKDLAKVQECSSILHETLPGKDISLDVIKEMYSVLSDIQNRYENLTASYCHNRQGLISVMYMVGKLKSEMITQREEILTEVN